MKREIDYSFGEWSLTVGEFNDEIVNLSLTHSEDGCIIVEATYRDIKELAEALNKDW